MPTTKLEKVLLELAAAERQRRQNSQADEAPPPVLDRLFHVPGTVQTVAQTWAAPVEMSLPEDHPLARAITSGQITDISMGCQVPEDFYRSTDSQVETSRGFNANGDQFPDLSVSQIAEMLLGREGRAQLDLAESMGMTLEASPDDSFRVEFDGADDLPRTQPNEAVRFQVGRQSPPAVHMVHRDTIPTGGEVVSTRGADGRFRPVATETARPASTAPLSHRRTLPTPEAPRRATSLPEAPEAPERQHRPTAWDRISGPDLIDGGDD